MLQQKFEFKAVTVVNQIFDVKNKIKQTKQNTLFCQLQEKKAEFFAFIKYKQKLGKSSHFPRKSPSRQFHNCVLEWSIMFALRILSNVHLVILIQW